MWLGCVFARVHAIRPSGSPTHISGRSTVPLFWKWSNGSSCPKSFFPWLCDIRLKVVGGSGQAVGRRLQERGVLRVGSCATWFLGHSTFPEAEAWLLSSVPRACSSLHSSLVVYAHESERRQGGQPPASALRICCSRCSSAPGRGSLWAHGSLELRPSCPHVAGTGGQGPAVGVQHSWAWHQREEGPKQTQAELGNLRARKEWDVATPPPHTHITKPLARGGPSWAEGKDSGPGADSLPASLLMAPVTAPSIQLAGPTIWPCLPSLSKHHSPLAPSPWTIESHYA